MTNRHFLPCSFVLAVCLLFWGCSSDEQVSDGGIYGTGGGKGMVAGRIENGGIMYAKVSVQKYMGEDRVLCETQTKETDNLDEAGNFEFPRLCFDDIEALYLMKAEGGVQLDSNGDGIEDAEPTPVVEDMHSIVSGRHILKLKPWKISALTQKAYELMERLIEIYGLTDKEISMALELAAETYLSKDTNENGYIDYDDILIWHPIIDQPFLTHEVNIGATEFYEANEKSLTTLEGTWLIQSTNYQSTTTEKAGDGNVIYTIAGGYYEICSFYYAGGTEYMTTCFQKFETGAIGSRTFTVSEEVFSSEDSAVSLHIENINQLTGQSIQFSEDAGFTYQNNAYNLTMQKIGSAGLMIGEVSLTDGVLPSDVEPVDYALTLVGQWDYGYPQTQSAIVTITGASSGSALLSIVQGDYYENEKHGVYEYFSLDNGFSMFTSNFMFYDSSDPVDANGPVGENGGGLNVTDNTLVFTINEQSYVKTDIEFVGTKTDTVEDFSGSVKIFWAR